MTEQPRLFEFLLEDRSPAALFISESNQTAWARIGLWRDWPGRAFLLAGPRGSGKSHMARAWAEASAAAWLRPGEGAQAAFARGQGRVVVDDADADADPGRLAYLLDAAKAEGGAVLLTAAEPPERWAGAHDLLSRLKALPSETLPEPDDRLLEALLMRLAKARFIKLHDKAVTYLVQRMERSYGAAQALTEALDRMHVRGSRPVTAAAAARALRSIEDASGEDASSQQETGLEGA